MFKKIYLHLLILCGILCHGIIATLSDEATRESSNLLVRKRRVISHLPGGLIPTRIGEVNYMVNIRKNGVSHCAGAILTHYIVITAAPCVSLSVSQYQVFSGAADHRYSNFHAIKWKKTHYGNFPDEDFDGIALITVDPPFEYSGKTGNIQLHVGLLSAGEPAKVSGWGCTYSIHPISGIQRRLRTITLPIMNHAECQAVYSGRFNITEKHLCTYDEHQHCASTDEGVPLVVGDKLVGIHVWKGKYGGLKNPDVFVNLQRADYREWIREHILLQ